MWILLYFFQILKFSHNFNIFDSFWPKFYNKTLSKPEDFMVAIQVFFLSFSILFWIILFSTHLSSFLSPLPFVPFHSWYRRLSRSHEGLGFFLGVGKILDVLQKLENLSPLMCCCMPAATWEILFTFPFLLPLFFITTGERQHD